MRKINILRHKPIHNLILYFLVCFNSTIMFATDVDERKNVDDPNAFVKTFFIGHFDNYNIKNEKKFWLMIQKGRGVYYRDKDI